MGFSLIASAAILAVTLFMAVEIITGSLLPTLEGINDSYSDMKERTTNQIQTDIVITTVSRFPDGPGYNYSITVQNTGSVTLSNSKFVILINGTVCTATCAHKYLYPNTMTNFTVISNAGEGDQRIKIITDNGVEAYYTYTAT